MSTKRKLPPFPDGTVNRSPQPKKRRVDSPATVRTPATPQSSPRTAKTKRAFTIRFTATAQNTSTIANERVFTIPIAPKRPFKMGRDPDTCEMLFAADTPMISRVHCQFMMGDASNNHQLFVKDFESTNGVFVNGHQIDKFGALKEVNEGDTVRLGRVFRGFNHSYWVSIAAASPTATSTATATAPNGNGNEQHNPNTGDTLNTTANVTANATHNDNDHRRSSASFEDLESVLSKALDKRMMAYNAKMEEKLAAKDEENGRMKQLLYEKEMAELKQQTEQQKLEWEQKQHAIEEQMREKEEENHKQQAMDLQKMEALEEAAKTKEMENERKLQECEQKQHAIEEQMREKEELARTLKAEKEQIEQQQLQQIEENHKQQAMDLQKMKALEVAAKTKDVENERKLQEMAETQKKQEEERRKESEELQRQKEEMAAQLKEQEEKDETMEEETTCCMCFDILMKAHSLECGHTMCHQCIREWIDSNANSTAVCPICRAEIKTEPTPCRILDNLIESLHIKHKSEAVRAEWDNRKKEYGEWKKTYQEAQKQQLQLQQQQQQPQNHRNRNRRNSNPVQAAPAVPVVPVVPAAAAAFGWPVPVPAVPMPIPPPPPPAQVVLPSTYSIERARSGRSTCRGCWLRIDHNSLRFAVHTGADPTQDVHYESTHYYHPHCYGARFRNEPHARDRRNIAIHASVFSTRELDALLLRIFTASNNQAAAGNNQDEDDVVVLPNPNRNVNANAGNRNANASSRQFMIDGINFRTRLNRLEHLTMPQLKKYCERNRVQGFNSLRKSALCAMIRRDINQHVGNR